MVIDITLTRTDWQRFNSYLWRRELTALKGVVGGPRNRLVLFALLTLWFMVLFAYMDRVHWPTAFWAATVTFIVMALFLINLWRLQRALAPSASGPFIGEHRFVFDSEGIHTEGEGYRSFHAWRTVQAVRRDDGLIMLFLDTTLAFSLPEDRLAAPDEVFNLVTHRVASAGMTSPEKPS